MLDHAPAATGHGAITQNNSSNSQMSVSVTGYLPRELSDQWQTNHTQSYITKRFKNHYLQMQ